MDKIADYIFYSLVILVCVFLLFIIGALGYTNYHYNIYYKYVDIDGNEGTATTCSTYQSVLHCNNNGKTITVKEYEMVMEER